MLEVRLVWSLCLIANHLSQVIQCQNHPCKVGDRCRGWPESFLFTSYCTKMKRRALLLSLYYSTLPLIHTLQCWVLSNEVSSTIFWVFGMTRLKIEPWSAGPLGIKAGLYLSKGICSKVNVIARMEFELAYFETAVHHFSHYATRPSSSRIWPLKRITCTTLQLLIFETSLLTLQHDEVLILIWFLYLMSLSTFLGYLMLNPLLSKNSSGTITV